MRYLFVSIMLILFAGCDENSPSVDLELSQESGIDVDWAVSRVSELACGGDEIAGGSSTAIVSFADLGESTLTASSAWDVGNQIDPSDAEFVPDGPAGGPVAPVLGQNDYPYDFHFNPLSGECGAGATATGQAVLTVEGGDKVYGRVTGGETHRLDFVNPGDGAESFVVIDFAGGTGRFQDATGSITTHSIIRLDYESAGYVIDLFEVLTGGYLEY